MVGEWNLGSCATEVLTLVDNVPSSISGTPIERIADRKRANMEEYTGASIGSTGIGLKYQSPLLAFTVADVLELMSLQGGDFSSISLSDFSINKGQGSNLNTMANNWRDKGEREMKELGHRIKFYKALG